MYDAFGMLLIRSAHGDVALREMRRGMAVKDGAGCAIRDARVPVCVVVILEKRATPALRVCDAVETPRIRRRVFRDCEERFGMGIIVAHARCGGDDTRW